MMYILESSFTINFVTFHPRPLRPSWSIIRPLTAPEHKTQLVNNPVRLSHPHNHEGNDFPELQTFLAILKTQTHNITSSQLCAQ
jgi:hypothetical protein